MLKGVFTAIVTPFNTDGSIDEESFRQLIEEQIKAGVAGIVPCGTTGESPTLTHEEHNTVIKIAADQVAGRCAIIAGTGSNSTQEAIEMTRKAKESGATHSLQVVPYYNKPTQNGMYLHFKAIAEAVDLPMVIYNIKSRTGINMETSTLLALAELPNIIGVKESSGDIGQMLDVIRNVPSDFSVLSGDDNLTLPLVAVGGHGVISVASNIIPEKMVEFCGYGLNNNFEAMRKLDKELADFFKVLFVETNPIPAKKILALQGKIKSAYRLPLCEPTDKTVELLKSAIEKL